ncbi:MAG TPA: outer membrane beta-barrel protein [Beijerinckiaceae bacterium]|nr:outer membrane beta-barrel protein [Beijerinckiaceae bacterium]
MRDALRAARPILVFVALCGFAWRAQASDWATPTLPTFAQSPASQDGSKDPWRGLYAGSELSFSSGRNGGLGGGAYAGYNREFANHWVIGIQGGVGYAPSLFPYSSAIGYNYGTVNVKAGYDMGRFLPFVTAGMALAKPSVPFVNYTGPMNAANDLFNSSGKLQTLTSVGAGFDYAINNNVSVEMSVSASQGGVAWPVQ